jgi:hypothetical protein
MRQSSSAGDAPPRYRETRRGDDPLLVPRVPYAAAERKVNRRESRDGIGRALVSSKRYAEALPFLGRALTIRRAHPADPALRAEAAFLLAQAHWETRDQGEALRQAEAARADYSTSEGYRRREAADVEAWLAGRSP